MSEPELWREAKEGERVTAYAEQRAGELGIVWPERIVALVRVPFDEAVQRGVLELKARLTLGFEDVRRAVEAVLTAALGEDTDAYIPPLLIEGGQIVTGHLDLPPVRALGEDTQ